MNRWARIQLGLGALGITVFAIAGAQGLLSAPSDETVALHTQLALVATLLLVLSYSWVSVFLLACERGLRRLQGVPPAAELLRARRRSVGWTVAAQAALIGHFAAAGSLYGTRVPGWIHGASAGVTFAILMLAWAIAATDLARHGTRIDAEDTRPGRHAKHDAVLDSSRS